MRQAPLQADEVGKKFETREERKRRKIMDNSLLIRIIAGVCFALVLGIMIQRRRKKVV
jgi:hypothetical protein